MAAIGRKRRVTATGRPLPTDPLPNLTTKDPVVGADPILTDLAELHWSRLSAKVSPRFTQAVSTDWHILQG